MNVIAFSYNNTKYILPPLPLHASLLQLYILVLTPFIHSPTFNPPSIRLPSVFVSPQVHAHGVSHHQGESGDSQLRARRIPPHRLAHTARGPAAEEETLGKARRKGRDGAGITRAGEGVGGGGRRGDVGGGVEGGGGEGVKGFVEAEVTFEMTPV